MMTFAELSDQHAIRDVLARYAHHADRKNARDQAAVFALDGRVRLYQADPATAEPIDTITGRAALETTFQHLIDQYDTTTYLNGQSLITIDGDTAEGETYCLAMHVLHEDGQRVLLTMSIRYLDTFVRTDDEWLIADRQLIFDWTDRRPSSP